MSQWPPRIVLHKSSGLARCRIKGKDYYLGKYGSPEAATAYARLVAELAAGQVPARAKDPPPLTVMQVVSDWTARVLPSYDPEGGEPDAFPRSIAPLLQLFGALPAKDFDAARLDLVRQEMVRKSWCRNVINRRVVRIRTLWRWAEAQGHVPRGSWAHLRTLPGLGRNNHAVRQTEAVQPAQWQDVKAVLRYCSPVVKMMLLMMWWSGMRSGEVCRMKAGEIERTGAVWLYRPTRHKMAYRGQARVIALGKKCQACLYKLLPDVGPDGWVFLSRLRRPYDGVSYARAVLRASRQAGVSLTPYSCRHAFKLRITRKFGLDAARAALGQSSLGSTNGYAAGQDVLTATRVAGEMC